MRMTIDDARRELISGKSYMNKFAIALVVAIDTMRKYQKIEQILDDYDLEAWEVLEIIKKVVEDGNDR